MYFLSIECKDGFYGVNCSDKCGYCDDNDDCDKRTGYCLMGCKTNLQPPYCKGFFFIELINFFFFTPSDPKRIAFFLKRCSFYNHALNNALFIKKKVEKKSHEGFKQVRIKKI